MIARSRLMGNFLSPSRVQCQLTKVVGLSQSARFQSTNDNSEKNITLKLPPNATGVSVEHSNETSSDGTSLRAILNVSVLQSHKSTPQSRQQFKTVNRTYSTVKTKYQYHQELKVTMKQRNEIFINGLSKNVLEDDLRAYFSQFGEIETCAAFVDWGYVTFKSYNAVKQVLNAAPHLLIGDRITNENAELFAEMKKLMRTKCQRFQELKVSRNNFNDKMISIDGLPQEISEYAIAAYFSQFGRVHLCGISGWVSFKSPKAVNQVLKSAPHYIAGDRITNENQELLTLLKRELKVTVSRRVKEWFSKIYSASKLTLAKVDMFQFVLWFYGTIILTFIFGAFFVHSLAQYEQKC